MNGNGIALRDELERTVVRWPVAAAAKVDAFVKRSVADAAGVQSRRVLAAAQAELCNRALRRFFELVFDQTPGGRFANVAEDGRIIIPTPWSRRQYAAYGLTDHGGRVLRRVFLLELSNTAPFLHPLLLSRGQWCVNLRKYGDLAAALAWLDRHQVTADTWLAVNDAMPRRGRA